MTPNKDWKHDVLQVIGTLLAFGGLTWTMVSPILTSVSALTIQSAVLATKLDNYQTTVQSLEVRIKTLEDKDREKRP